MGRSHDHAFGIDHASVSLLVAEDHAMYSRSDDSCNVHNLGPSVDVCMEYRILVVLLACCHYQCQLQFHLFFSSGFNVMIRVLLFRIKSFGAIPNVCCLSPVWSTLVRVSKGLVIIC